ncbi:uroporphyrinogen-III C-methyltransferase [Texcoconibacillus texcoconensis]|uniref:Uroporphyrinogen-III C-methyltransferase n=1 Tax=Texcoconibacillus texcoconensis TaxID=1095777 RepID=A0A840QRT5_9BACI|nr:uroporphyrinogen-III C-methyltransferase [Texcoconibacillus texcoconensis]MBB5174033.1 uroporphyrinogen III methyltransferase/synthase [Texcoconibacillus texcoconensis]
MRGFVSFVGAGPGDLGLMTEKGIQSLRKADVVLYDRLANPRLLRNTKADCEFIYCGKLPKRHVIRQELINQSLIDYALQGLHVVRLKGGDPSVFGRVGEEAEALEDAGVQYEIIPGVTSSVAAASYAGIPVTHREYSTSFTIRTGHYCLGKEHGETLQQKNGDTIAYYMGIGNLEANCQSLINDGLSPDTKVAVIEWATTGKQRVVEGTLLTINDVVNQENIQNPAMTIIGDVVSLRKKLAWFDNKPFCGKRLLIANGPFTDNEIEQYFLHLGAEAYTFPTLFTKTSALSNEEVNLIMTAEKLLFTSTESVNVMIDAFLEIGLDVRDLPRNIYCTSEKTKHDLKLKGLQADRVGKIDSDMLVVGDSFVGDKDCVQTNPHIKTHRLVSDERFYEVDQRMLEETSWHTVVFPDCAAVDWFIKEAQAIGFSFHKLSFAYIDPSVKEYAKNYGFTKLDEDVQTEIDHWYSIEHNKQTV